MSRKTYQLIARDIAMSLDLANTQEAILAVQALARKLCYSFECTNSGFNRDKFLAACGISGEL